MRKVEKIAFWTVATLALLIFCYFRLKPIYFQTVPYTYDQGRDFLKAEEIIRDRNITLIGPTTGVQGLFHGAWWYYYLAVPYLFLQGLPIGFPAFILFTFLISSILFFLFLKKEAGLLPALFFITLLATSPYFILISIFAINSFLSIPFLLLLLYSIYKYLKEEKSVFAFLSFLSLGLIIESELAFGFFIIPAFFATLLLTGLFKKLFFNKKNLIASLAGFIIAFTPRALFEIKNGFMQTKTLLNFIFNPSSFQSKTLREIFLERIDIFWNYYVSLYPSENILAPVLILLIGLIGIVIGFKKKTLISKYLRFVTILLVFFFISTLLYKNTLWANYIEGVSLFYVLLIALGIHSFSHYKNKIVAKTGIIAVIAVLILGLNSFTQEFKSQKKPELTGMIEQIATTEEVYKNAGRDNLCVRIYTPPVIPYTYNYLFSYYEKKGFKKPSDKYVRSKCYLIIEKDECKFKDIEVKEKNECLGRVENWKKANIPREATMLKKIIINKKISIEQWQHK